MAPGQRSRRARAQQRARLVDARGRDLEIEVARERALDQAVERRIAELLPPRRLERLLVEDRRIRVAELGRRRLRRPVVGPDGTRGEQQLSASAAEPQRSGRLREATR